MDISKLPKKYQEYIEDIIREKELAVKKLMSYLDNQKESNFYCDEILCIKTKENSANTITRKYFDTHKISICVNEVIVNILDRDDEIDISFGLKKHETKDDGVFIVPNARNSISIVRAKQYR